MAIDTETQLRGLIGGGPTPLVAGKVADRLNDIFRRYIEESPFVCVATASASGDLDLSPRGDPAGFVRILDERTLFIPERPGNRIADTLTNVLDTGRSPLLFLLPGVAEPFRVTGTAELVDDPDLLGASVGEGKPPKL